MKTYSFIGSDKNAGKTTSFNHVCHALDRAGESRPLCISSIGINGEGTDQYEGGQKPPVRLMKHHYFVTACKHLDRHTGKYQIIKIYSEPMYRKKYVFGQSLVPFHCIIEGPNTGSEILMLKTDLSHYFWKKFSGLQAGKPSEEAVFLIDGSIDRQFIAQPDISDGFYFSILFSKREQQKKKAEGFLRSIAFPECSKAIKTSIIMNKTDKTKSMLIEGSEVVYHGQKMPFDDDALLESIFGRRGKKVFLYINGALTKTLHDVLAPLKHLHVILDNFTLYLNISPLAGKYKIFYPGVSLLNPVHIKKVFIKQETDFDRTLLPESIEIINLFRNVSYEVGI